MINVYHEFRKKGVQFALDNEKLIYEAPLGVLTADDIKTMRENKAVIIAALQQANAQSDDPIPRVNHQQRLPLSLMQQRLWFIEKLNGAGKIYHLQAAATLQGVLNSAALSLALEAIIARHDILRSVFVAVEGEAIQQVKSSMPLSLVWHDIRSQDSATQQATLQHTAKAAMQQAFDLTQGPLMRVCVVRIADNAHVLFITMHHIIADGWSQALLFKEL